LHPPVDLESIDLPVPLVYTNCECAAVDNNLVGCQVSEGCVWREKTTD